MTNRGFMGIAVRDFTFGVGDFTTAIPRDPNRVRYMFRIHSVNPLKKLPDEGLRRNIWGWLRRNHPHIFRREICLVAFCSRDIQ